ncbi:MAG: AraC family transcriptional regulator [Pseudomonadota bacterium]
MLIPPNDEIIRKFREQSAEVHTLQVTADRNVLCYDVSYPAQEGPVPKIPAMFALMCISGGGYMWQRTTKQDFKGHIDPGGIGIVLPSSSGFGSWPEMRVIGFAIVIPALAKGFGKTWPSMLKKEVLSQPVRDPMIEATMMQVGYTHAGSISDSVLLHAAHMIVHHLLDTPADPATEPEKSDAHPLPEATVDRITAYVVERIEHSISVEELAKHVGISRYHFSRRFRAACGKSPYQFILDLKLDHAANTLSVDRDTKIVEAAHMVGYRNPARFSEAFRRRFGQSPRQWLLSRR